MGRSKATVPFLGEPLICRGVRRLLSLTDDFIITTNEPQNLGFVFEMPEVMQWGGEVRLQPDLIDVRGSLNGVYTALKTARKDYVALVACDMIFASPRLICAELAALKETGADAAVPVTFHGGEPFHSVYRRERCLELVEDLFEVGASRVNDLFDICKVEEFTKSRVLEAEPRGGCFMNVNTPEELHAMEERIAGGHMKTIDGSGKDD